MAVFPTIFGHALFNWALRYVKAAVASVSTLGKPMGAAILAYFIFGEVPSLLQLVGGCIILTGLYILLPPSGSRKRNRWVILYRRRGDPNMNLQLIHTTWGCSAAAWENGLLAGVTLPHDNEKEAIDTLAGYLKTSPASLSQKRSGIVDDLQQRLAEKLTGYFAGKQGAFDLPLRWPGLTPFQQRVLKVVKEIPYGQTLSYGEIARQIGCPRGARAVGGAVGANPWLLVVPCHRVLAGNRQIGGFGCGLDWKVKLLQLEKIHYKTSHLD